MIRTMRGAQQGAGLGRRRGHSGPAIFAARPISVGVLLASGIVNSWYEVGSVTNLIANPYGRLVLLKLGAFRVPLLAQNGQVCLLRQPLHSPINFGC